MSSVNLGVNSFLNSHVMPVLEVLFIYFVIVAVGTGVLFIVEPVSSVEELDYELREFIQYYKETSWWWLSTFFTTVVALTVGSGPGLLVDLGFLSVFVAPAILYYHRGFPFSLKCDYRARTPSGQTAIGEERENIATLDDGQYVLEFPITTGSNIDDFTIDLSVPDGVEVWSSSAIKGVGLSEDETTIEGGAPPGNAPFVFELILDETTGVQRGANLLVLSDARSNRELTTVRLMP